MNQRSLSANIKIGLLIAALLIAAGTLYYTQILVKKLQMRERDLVELYAKGLEYVTDINRTNTDLTFIFENIIKRIYFPLILTDAHDKVNLSGMGGGYKNIQIDSTKSKEEIARFFEAKITELKKFHPPILVTYQDSIILTKIYYGDSELIRQLKYYPYLQIFFAVMFVLISYIGFSHVKRSEQSNIWVGMAKETAHQLGTPISSLMGWLELLKMHHRNPDKVRDAVEEMGGDLERLNKITKRFSKIGSKPELKLSRVNETLDKVLKYYKRRIPQTGKNVDIKISGKINSEAMLNVYLFEWVLENLIKNALDAIEGKEGLIEIKLQEDVGKCIIDVSDSGKGIDMKNRKEIFRPGFSTKKRGWGLGLSLSKRIVENYHNGKIYVKSSIPDEGTTFRIILNKK
jgi:two-component sensor histidine kinase